MARRPAMAHTATAWAMRVAFLGESKSKVHQLRIGSDCGQYTSNLDFPNKFRSRAKLLFGRGPCATAPFSAYNSSDGRRNRKNLRSSLPRLRSNDENRRDHGTGGEPHARAAQADV